MPRGGPRAPAGRRHPLPWFCESHEVSALHASLASPCPSPATRALATWACLLPSLVSLFSLSCCYAVSIVTMPQTRPLCQGSVPLQKAVSSAERPLSALSPADPHLSPQISLPDFHEACLLLSALLRSTPTACPVRARLHIGKALSVCMVSPHTALDSLRPMDDIFAMAVWSATGLPRGPRLAL